MPCFELLFEILHSVCHSLQLILNTGEFASTLFLGLDDDIHQWNVVEDLMPVCALLVEEAALGAAMDHVDPHVEFIRELSPELGKPLFHGNGLRTEEFVSNLLLTVRFVLVDATTGTAVECLLWCFEESSECAPVGLSGGFIR